MFCLRVEAAEAAVLRREAIEVDEGREGGRGEMGAGRREEGEVSFKEMVKLSRVGESFDAHFACSLRGRLADACEIEIAELPL